MSQRSVYDVHGLIAALGGRGEVFPRTKHLANRHRAERIGIERRGVESGEGGLADGDEVHFGFHARAVQVVRSPFIISTWPVGVHCSC